MRTMTTKVNKMLDQYELTRSADVLYDILDTVLNTRIDSTAIYDRIYCFDSLLFKNLAIKCAPEDWLRGKMMCEKNTQLVGLMIERSKRENLKYDANALIHAANWQVRLYATQKANTRKEILKQLMVETDHCVLKALMARV